MTPTEQRTTALANALATRQATYRLRDNIQAGTTSIAGILTNPPPETLRLTLLDVMAMTRRKSQGSRWQEALGEAAARDGINLLSPIGRASLAARMWAVVQLEPRPTKKRASKPATPPANGQPGPAATRLRVRNAPRQTMLPAAPFAQWLQTIANRSCQEEAARQIGVGPRRVRGWLTGEYQTVSLTVVDNALTHYGDPGLLHDLYPLTDDGMEIAA